jgi:hypothetical protein
MITDYYWGGGLGQKPDAAARKRDDEERARIQKETEARRQTAYKNLIVEPQKLLQPIKIEQPKPTTKTQPTLLIQNLLGSQNILQAQPPSGIPKAPTATTAPQGVSVGAQMREVPSGISGIIGGFGKQILRSGKEVVQAAVRMPAQMFQSAMDTGQYIFDRAIPAATTYVGGKVTEGLTKPFMDEKQHAQAVELTKREVQAQLTPNFVRNAKGKVSLQQVENPYLKSAQQTYQGMKGKVPEALNIASQIGLGASYTIAPQAIAAGATVYVKSILGPTRTKIGTVTLRQQPSGAPQLKEPNFVTLDTNGKVLEKAVQEASKTQRYVRFSLSNEPNAYYRVAQNVDKSVTIDKYVMGKSAWQNFKDVFAPRGASPNEPHVLIGEPVGAPKTPSAADIVKQQPGSENLVKTYNYSPSPNHVLVKSWVDDAIRDTSAQLSIESSPAYIADPKLQSETIKALEGLKGNSYRTIGEFVDDVNRAMPSTMGVAARQQIIRQASPGIVGLQEPDLIAKYAPKIFVERATSPLVTALGPDDLKNLTPLGEKSPYFRGMLDGAQSNPDAFSAIRDPGGKAIGLINFDIEGKSAYVANVWVEPSARGHGVATEAIHSIFMKNPNVSIVRGDSLNTPGDIAFWKSMGAQFLGDPTKAATEFSTTPFTLEKNNFIMRLFDQGAIEPALPSLSVIRTNLDAGLTPQTIGAIVGSNQLTPIIENIAKAIANPEPVATTPKTVVEKNTDIIKAQDNLGVKDGATEDTILQNYLDKANGLLALPGSTAELQSLNTDFGLLTGITPTLTVSEPKAPANLAVAQPEAAQGTVQLAPAVQQVIQQATSITPEIAATIPKAAAEALPAPTGSLTVFHGSRVNGKPTVAKLEKNFENVLAVKGDQRNLIRALVAAKVPGAAVINKNFSYGGADAFIQKTLGGQYGVIRYSNVQMPEKGVEFHDLTDNRFYAVNEETAKAYAAQTREAKYGTQQEVVKGAVAEEPKSVKQIAKETKILEPNVRRILGVGAKEGTFTRVEKGVYVLSKGGKDVAWIETGNALESVPKLAADGFKADMVFLDIPYEAAGNKGGNRMNVKAGTMYNFITPTQFEKFVDDLKGILRNPSTPVIHMYSQSKSSMKESQKYLDVLLNAGFKPLAKGDYYKMSSKGTRLTMPMRPDALPPEGIIIFNQTGKFNFNQEPKLDFYLVRPKGYKTEKPAALLRDLITLTTQEGEMVFDPFAGSGVTLEQAIKTGRLVRGIEVSPQAVEEHIKPRVEAALKLQPQADLGKEENKLFKPIFTKQNFKTLLKNNDEFMANPTLTVVEKTTAEGRVIKQLTFKGKTSTFSINTDAIGLKSENLKVGDVITVDTTALKAGGHPQQMRVMRGNEVYGFKPKNLTEPDSIIANTEVTKIVKRSEIADILSEKLRVPIRRGKFNRAGALGIYKPGPKVVRIKSGGLSTVFHEVGHFLDDQFNLSKDIGLTERKALMEEYGYSYEGQPKKQRKEALAEFLRYRMTGQEARATKMAPNFSKVFDTRMANLPEIKDVLDTAANDFKRWQEMPAAAKVFSQLSIDEGAPKGTLKERLTENIHTFYTQMKDELHPISLYTTLAKKLGIDVPTEKDPYALARLLRGWVGKADTFLNKGTFGKNFWKTENGKVKPNFTGPGLTEILKPVEKAGALNDFRTYVTAQRALELADRGITTGIGRDVAQQAVDEILAKYPAFKQVADDLYAYSDSLLKYAADNGLVGEKGLERIRELNKFRVPFYRIMEEVQRKGIGGGKKVAGNIPSPIKRIKGSERDIIDPLESIVKDTYAIINAAERNNIGVAMANLATQNPELARLFEKVDKPLKPITVNVEEVLKKALAETGVSTSDIPEDLGEAAVTLFRAVEDRGANMLNVQFGDTSKVFQVDPAVFKALQGLNTEDTGMVMRLLGMPARLLRAGATLSPDFSVRNPFRDQFTAFVYSRYGYIPGVDLVRGMFELFRKGDLYNLFKMSGAEHSMFVSMDRDYLQKTFKEILRSKGATTLEYLKHPIDALRALSEFGEKGTRLGEMQRALASGENPLAAGMAAREVTLDFARTGGASRAINTLIAFWNAQVEGADKMARAFKSHPYSTLFKTFMGITLPSILLYLKNRKDPRWKEIPAWQKDLFWIVMTPKHIYRIPKPFELGVIFGSLPERIMEYIETHDKQAFGQIEQSIKSGLTPGYIPTALLPFIENATNYSFFLNRSIVPSGKENLPGQAQYGPTTSDVAKIAGNILGYSPAKIDNLISGYSGGLGKYTTSALDTILEKTGITKAPKAPAKQLEDQPVLKAFMVRPPVGTSSESVNRVYKLYGKAIGDEQYAKALLAKGDNATFVVFIRKNPEVAYAPLLRQVIAQYSDLNKARDDARSSRELTPEQKQRVIRALDELQTDVAQKTLAQIDEGR